MNRRRRRHSAEHVNHERWLVSYADFITLLFAFFVVLYASSQVDKHKVNRLAASIQVAFQQLGVFDSSHTKIPLIDADAPAFTQAQVVRTADALPDFSHFVEPLEGTIAPAPAGAPFRDVQREVEQSLAPEIKNHVVDVHSRRDGLVISLQEAGFYESGSANVRPTSRSAVDRLAAILKNRTESLRVEGHTDNVPIHSSQFSSNWELSTARASDLIKLFILRYGIFPERLSASGFAEYHPLASNDTAAGRARNRRVDIVILNPPVFESAPASQSATVTRGNGAKN